MILYRLASARKNHCAVTRSLEENMISAKFLRSAQDKKDYPQEGLVELAFAGRSNVGKSSLDKYFVGQTKSGQDIQNPWTDAQIELFSH